MIPRSVVRYLLLAVLFLALAPVTVAQQPTERDLTAPLTTEAQAALTPTEVIQLLKDGNQRFLNDEALERDFRSQVRQTAEGQYPMAVILSSTLALCRIGNRIQESVVEGLGYFHGLGPRP